ncbi:MAG: transcriptional repressor LexA [Sedimentisphaerales bacterium]|jgi:repressor LexA
MSQTKEEQATGEGLTPRQVQLLSTIAGFRTSRGYLPTIGELAQQLSISRTTAFGHIEQLRRKGLLSGQQCPSTKARARSLNLTSKARRRLKQIPDIEHQASSIPQKGSLTGEHRDEGIPLVGRVAAGLPVEAVENKDYLSIESCFGNTGDIFALEVKGDSMVGENIREGDYVICKRTATASNGQLVVAIVDNEDATLKRFYRENNLVRLQPANDAYEPIYSNNCQIQGVVIGLVRKL